MSAIIANYELVMKDDADPSTGVAAANLNADRYSEIIPVERAFVGDIIMIFGAGPVGNMIFQVSNDFGAGDDEGVGRINSNNIITNWVVHTTTAIGSTETFYKISLTDIGYRWGRLFWDSTSGSGVISSSRANIKGW